MKAVVCTKLGEPNLLEIKEVDKPTIGKDEVLIKVEVAGVNFPDALLVQGKYQIVIDPPFIPGNEVCGIIEDKGENVDIPVGTKVIGIPPIGGFAEFVTINKIFKRKKRYQLRRSSKNSKIDWEYDLR